MSQPLAVLNDEEMHWLDDLGLPNQRRWLNHRTLGDEHRRTFPSAATDSSIKSRQKSTKGTKNFKRQARSITSHALKKQKIILCFLCLLWQIYLCFFVWLTERDLSGAALLVFEARADFQQAVKHLRTLGAARAKLRICLFVHVLQSVQLISDV